MANLTPGYFLKNTFFKKAIIIFKKQFLKKLSAPSFLMLSKQTDDYCGEILCLPPQESNHNLIPFQFSKIMECNGGCGYIPYADRGGCHFSLAG